MSNGNYAGELAKMVEAGQIKPDEAIRFLVVLYDEQQKQFEQYRETMKQSDAYGEQRQATQHQELLTLIGKLREEIDVLNQKIGDLITEGAKYRPLTWYWHHKRKDLIIVLIGIGLLYTIIFSPLTVSDLREIWSNWLLSSLGGG